MKKVHHIHQEDNVVIALLDLTENEIININDINIEVKQSISSGNKIALTEIEKGSLIYKYGCSIGHATQAIAVGEWVHTHNIKTNLSETSSYQFQPKNVQQPVVLPERMINVFQRNNNDIAIRNELWVIPTVGCVNGISQQIVNEFKRRYNPQDIDGVFVFTHQFGCSQLGADHENTKLILGNLVKHPNAGGCLVVGLGCENNQIAPFKAGLGEIDDSRIQFMTAQKEQDEIEIGVEKLAYIYQTMRQDKRSSVSIGRLKVGLECGGQMAYLD